MKTRNKQFKLLAFVKSNVQQIAFLTFILLQLGMVSCQKESEAEYQTVKKKQTVIDYVLDLENLYMIKYRFEYNNQYQVTRIYRGERQANASQLQLIAVAHYDQANQSNLPDSLSTYNTRGYKVGVIQAKDFNSIAKPIPNQIYDWPTRENKLLTVPGGELAFAIAGKKIGWSGAGHMGSGNTIDIMDHLKLLNRSNLKDSIQLAVTSKTDGTKRMFDDFHILYNNLGFPIDMSMYDRLNAGFEQLKINYREE